MWVSVSVLVHFVYGFRKAGRCVRDTEMCVGKLHCSMLLLLLLSLWLFCLPLVNDMSMFTYTHNRNEFTPCTYTLSNVMRRVARLCVCVYVKTSQTHRMYTDEIVRLKSPHISLPLPVSLLHTYITNIKPLELFYAIIFCLVIDMEKYTKNQVLFYICIKHQRRSYRFHDISFRLLRMLRTRLLSYVELTNAHTTARWSVCFYAEILHKKEINKWIKCICQW